MYTLIQRDNKKKRIIAHCEKESKYLLGFSANKRSCL